MQHVQPDIQSELDDLCVHSKCLRESENYKDYDQAVEKGGTLSPQQVSFGLQLKAVDTEIKKKKLLILKSKRDSDFTFGFSDKENEETFGSKWETGKKQFQQRTKKLAGFSLLQAKSKFCTSKILSALEVVQPALKLVTVVAILLAVIFAISSYHPGESTTESGSINGTSGVEIEKTAVKIEEILRKRYVQRNQRRQDQLKNGRKQESPHEDPAFLATLLKQMEENLDKESLQSGDKHKDKDEARPGDQYDEQLAKIFKRRAMERMKRQQEQLKDGEVLKPDTEDPTFIAHMLQHMNRKRERNGMRPHEKD
mmetsp:Transcript_19167/g.26527  ORF Transcript_19167/g.26527 Transcript_19167/m.26527 type:complete len:311 (+) Transcript_19167:101-1033(+)|eukprot:CAMPEP_0196584920 /NCGR_PEP_ID=MMETSP1081-20130531/48985_1 /TAXON_ID=36882 /ORGANISM="Pyramimonas amylifera, Strain CCMP720" /LENGTH=310 /DNA_ID=CAMNT_0041906307 /DNA_START=98 /DNA_END=1030 /DNA_ORIENTATION=+